MSTNKHATIRYQVLDRCFRNPGKMFFIEDLLEECNKALLDVEPTSNGIQKRQLFEDIKFMESEQGWSVFLKKEKLGRRTYYRYEDLSFSINGQGLNATEVEQIKSALQIISKFSGTPQFEWINEMIPKLESTFGIIKREKEVICFDSNIDLTGLHFLTPIFNAIINKRVIQLEYKDFKYDQSYEITLHPHYLKQYNNRWFAFGLNENKQIHNWTIALDRIQSIQETRAKYQASQIEWEEYFDDLIGVTRKEGVEVQEVTLKFEASLAPYILTKPIHLSQKSKMDATGLEIRIKVIPNYELESLILSYGERVEVISPSDLRESIIKRISEMAKIY